MAETLPQLSRARRELLASVAEYGDYEDSERHRHSNITLRLRGSFGREYRGKSDDELWAMALKMATDYGIVQDTAEPVAEETPVSAPEVSSDQYSVERLQEQHRWLEQRIAETADPQGKKFYEKLHRLHEEVCEDAKHSEIKHLVDVLAVRANHEHQQQ